MRKLQYIGTVLILTGIFIFVSLSFFGRYHVSENVLDEFFADKQFKSKFFTTNVRNELSGKTYSSVNDLADDLLKEAQQSHDYHRLKIKELKASGASQEKIDQEWSKVIWLRPAYQHTQLSYPLALKAADGLVVDHKVLFWWLTFGITILGGLLFILPEIKLLGPPGVKNDGIYHNSSTNRGSIAWLVFFAFIGFYLILFFAPHLIVNQIHVVDPISRALSKNPASQWFLYGFMYTTVMTVMAIRMYIKYRYNKYQMVRTTSVVFFQIVFAFLIPEILVRLQMPYNDFKNAWPLNYSFFYDSNISELIDNGNVGLFMLVWGIILSAILVPVLAYFYGKRWYCSWVCGCGGLAETMGDPYRQHSDKSLRAWKIERYLVHGVLVFAVLMTGATLYTYFSGSRSLLGISTDNIRLVYGLGIGSIFAGVVGVGFYPIFGNRVWCRFGCPLAAYLGIVQRFKSRFRITTNGNQCISCGNCSTYCEQGIDVRAYAQKGENIVRASCVGCGVCASVCPRGVLKLENGPEEKRIISDPIQVTKDGITLTK